MSIPPRDIILLKGLLLTLSPSLPLVILVNAVSNFRSMATITVRPSATTVVRPTPEPMDTSRDTGIPVDVIPPERGIEGVNRLMIEAAPV